MSNIEKTLELQGVVQRPVTFHKPLMPFIKPQRSEHSTKQGVFPHYIFAPVHYEPGYSYPLIVWLHGSGSDETQLFRIMPKMSMRNYVAVAPRGLTRDESNHFRSLRHFETQSGMKRIGSTYDWSESEMGMAEAENRIFDSIAMATNKYNVNRRRIFLVGFDVGGTMALRLAMRYPQKFAGVVSLCGSFPEGNIPLSNWSMIRDFPILMTVGSDSSVYSVERAAEQLRLFHSAGMFVSIRQYKTGQELTSKMLSDVNRWIMDRII